MKAAYMTAQGGPEVLAYGDVPDPVAGDGQIVVDIHAASVNGADWKVRAGDYAPIAAFPYILGRDFSGTVAARGKGVSDFKVGDAVFGVLAPGHEGTYCEKVVMDAAICAAKPAGMSHLDAAALALTGLTAIISVEDTLKLKSGETILIQGGAGGVASYAIQLARHIGARVITTASAANHDYLRGLGADEVIDYRAQDFTKVVKDVDAVFETVGGDVATKSFQVVRPGGRIAFIASGGKAPPSPRADVEALRPAVGRSRKVLERIGALHESGAVKVPEVTTYTLQQAQQAHRVSEGRHLRGKLVFKVR
jgi:NADPH:quinone reductase-like Zn-dependent oxidoreductase